MERTALIGGLLEWRRAPHGVESLPLASWIGSELRPRTRVDATVRGLSGSFLQVQSSDELVGRVCVRSDGHRVCPLRDLPRKPQPVEALLMGVNRELGKPVGAYIEVELEVVVLCGVGFAHER